MHFLEFCKKRRTANVYQVGSPVHLARAADRISRLFFATRVRSLGMLKLDAHLDALAKRWSAALAGARLDAALIAAGAPRNYFLDDQSGPYRPNPHFAQWLPG